MSRGPASSLVVWDIEKASGMAHCGNPSDGTLGSWIMSGEAAWCYAPFTCILLVNKHELTHPLNNSPCQLPFSTSTTQVVVIADVPEDVTGTVISTQFLPKSLWILNGSYCFIPLLQVGVWWSWNIHSHCLAITTQSRNIDSPNLLTVILEKP